MLDYINTQQIFMLDLLHVKIIGKSVTFNKLCDISNHVKFHYDGSKHRKSLSALMILFKFHLFPPRPVCCREPGEQQVDEHAQC